MGVLSRVIDDNGNDVSDYNVTGELCVRGPTVFLGYFNNPAANRDSFDSEGFYHTGDVGYCDGASRLWYLVDRKKELIKVRAFQVAPPEIEAVLLSHPQIIDTAVIGVQAGNYDDQVPRAYVVKRPGKDGDKLTEADVKQFMEGKLAKYKNLDGGIRFINAVPKTASGKILKRVLREQAKKEVHAKL